MALNNIGIQSTLVPAGFTSELQPLDVSVNKLIKDILKNEWEKWFDCPNPVLTKAGNRQRPSYQDLIDMTADALLDQIDYHHKQNQQDEVEDSEDEEELYGEHDQPLSSRQLNF